MVVGSAPGGTHSPKKMHNRANTILNTAAIFFSTYDTLKRISPLREEHASVNHMLSASVAEVVSCRSTSPPHRPIHLITARQAACLIRVPTEVVKSRAQVSTQGGSSRPSFAAARHVLSNDGLSGFYRGFGSTIMREVSSSRKAALLQFH